MTTNTEFNNNTIVRNIVGLLLLIFVFCLAVIIKNVIHKVRVINGELKESIINILEKNIGIFNGFSINIEEYKVNKINIIAIRFHE